MHTASKTGPEKLIETHRSYAHAIAAEIARRLPAHIDRAEIQAAAELGLVEAAAPFDPSRGVLFKTFAYYRIRGAVYDCLHKMAWLSRSQYQAYRFERAANEFLKDYAIESPRAGTPADEYQDLKNVAGSLASCYLLSLDATQLDLAEDAGRSPERQTLSKEEKARLRTALAELPEKNRRVLESYYFEELSLEETGARLGLSKSWVSRLHAKSIEMIRQVLERKPSAHAARDQLSGVRRDNRHVMTDPIAAKTIHPLRGQALQPLIRPVSRAAGGS